MTIVLPTTLTLPEPALILVVAAPVVEPMLTIFASELVPIFVVVPIELDEPIFTIPPTVVALQLILIVCAAADVPKVIVPVCAPPPIVIVPEKVL